MSQNQVAVEVKVIKNYLFVVVLSMLVWIDFKGNDNDFYWNSKYIKVNHNSPIKDVVSLKYDDQSKE